ncbi:ribonuclease E/G [Lentibacter sp. XHP0401]|jgi:ribonuclease G|uniref:ribonuclease E/G n=1 Tax=Lentibacter sp. XHP0401 TaxID=2984334 RepID=UPI0021E88FA9|nr:ribonuclease E/G [Lentibacter sp. XHP0401]MCV2894357.1 ribonuclease E/G [Lentibacter sp. XHP0401]
MKGRQIILDHLGTREAAALMVDGQLHDLLVEADAPRPGTIYRARATKPQKGQGGIFLETPDGNAFLKQVKGIAPGDMLTVQLTGYAEESKALPVTLKLLFKSRYAIVTPDAPGLNISRSIRDDARRDELMMIAKDEMQGLEMGLILRSSCEEASDEDIAEDLRAMVDLAQTVLGEAGTAPEVLTEGDSPHVLAWRDWVEPADIVTEAGSFASHGVLEAVDALQNAYVKLAGGASLYIEPTRALTAVDVNTGADGSFAAGTRANFACAKELPRQLRLRGLGGQITIDLAPMPKKDRRGFEASLRAALKADGIDTVLAGFTPLGHYELQRKRARLPLAELLNEANA